MDRQTEDEAADKEIVLMPENMQTKSIEPAQAFAGGTGTQDDPYQIANKEQLALLSEKSNGDDAANYVSANYVFTDNIVINDVSDYDTWNEQAPEFGWTPIKKFDGVFDGNGFSITGMFICTDKTVGSDGNVDIALFGSIAENSTIKNVKLEKSYVYSYNFVTSVAGIVGFAYSGSISNCTSDAKVYGVSTNIGGVVGFASNTVVSGCVNNGDITGSRASTCGGVFGYYSGYEMRECTNNGTVTGLEDGEIGGIAGSIDDNSCSSKTAEENDDEKFHKNYVHYDEANFSELENKGNVKILGQGKAGGIAGIVQASRTNMFVSDISNSGTVEFDGTKATELGGMFATVLTLSSGYGGGADLPDNSKGCLYISDCVNNGKIVNTSSEAANIYSGLFGTMLPAGISSINMENCVNNAEAQGDAVSSGVVGNLIISDGAQVKFDKCENNMAFTTARMYVGGIISSAMISSSEDESMNAELKLIDCKNNAVINASNESAKLGGIVGFISTSRPNKIIYIENCENAGKLVGNKHVYAGGIVGNILSDSTVTSTEISGCVSSATITVNGVAEGSSALERPIVGGIAGVINGNNEISDNQFTSNIEIVGDSASAVINDSVGMTVGK